MNKLQGRELLAKQQCKYGIAKMDRDSVSLYKAVKYSNSRCVNMDRDSVLLYKAVKIWNYKEGHSGEPRRKTKL
jgi:hypothetical protein